MVCAGGVVCVGATVSGDESALDLPPPTSRQNHQQCHQVLLSSALQKTVHFFFCCFCTKLFTLEVY